MKVLMLSTDKKLLDSGSSVFERHFAYAKECGSLDVLVLDGKGEAHRDSLLVRGSRRFLGALFAAWKLPKPEVVTVQDPFETGLIGFLIARWFKVPLHVQVHTDFLSRSFVRGRPLNRIRRLIARYVLQRASRIRVVSESIRESLDAHSSKLSAPISVLPIFVDIAKYANITRTKHDRFKIALLWVGRFEEEKNPLFAVQLLEIARKNGHDAGLTLVGSGSLESRLREYVRARGLERYVEFGGWQENLTPFFSVADIMLVTSAYEGYGMALIEALAAGVPVLSLDVGVARESGAIVVGRQKEMGRALLDWIAHGPRKGNLQNYPYIGFESYVHAWCEDIRSALKRA